MLYIPHGDVLAQLFCLLLVAVPLNRSESNALLTSDDHLNELYSKQLAGQRRILALEEHLNTLQHAPGRQLQQPVAHGSGAQPARTVAQSNAVGNRLQHGASPAPHQQTVARLQPGVVHHPTKQVAAAQLLQQQSGGVGAVYQSRAPVALSGAERHYWVVQDRLVVIGKRKLNGLWRRYLGWSDVRTNSS